VDFTSGAGLLHRLTSYASDREWDVGLPKYRSRASGRPGAPVEIRMVAPRLGSS
jgi:hypothetical protein